MHFRLETILWIILIGSGLGCQEEKPTGSAPAKKAETPAKDRQRQDVVGAPGDFRYDGVVDETPPAFAVTFSGKDPANWLAEVRASAGDHEYVFVGFEPGVGLTLVRAPEFGKRDLKMSLKADGSGATSGALRFKVRDLTMGTDHDHVEPWSVDDGGAESTTGDPAHPGLTIAMSAIELAVQLAKLGALGGQPDDFGDEYEDDYDEDEYY